MKTAVIYARYSSDSQSEQSIEGQLRVCQKFAKDNDILILDTYIDRAMTGTNDLRPDFQRMIKDSAKKQWDYVLVYKLDRFSRNKYETTIHKHALTSNGVKVLSAMENIPDTPEGIILESLLEGMNQYYSAELSQKILRGLRESYIKGNNTGGKPLYGYKVVNKKNVIDENEGPIVTEIFKRFAKGETGKSIADNLIARGIRTKRGHYVDDKHIYQLIANIKYTGKVKHGDEIYTNIYPALIDEQTWKRVQEIRETNKHKPGNKKQKFNFLLSGKLICGECHKYMFGESGTSRLGSRYKYYTCSNKRKKRADCSLDSVSKEWLEDLVIKTTWNLLSSNEEIDLLVNAIYNKHQQINKENEVIKSLEKKRNDALKASNNLISAIEQGIITEQTKERLKQLETEISQLDFDIEQAKQRNYSYLTPDKIKDYFKRVLYGNLKEEETRKHIIRCLIREIILYKDKIIITYNFIDKGLTNRSMPDKIEDIDIALNLEECQVFKNSECSYKKVYTAPTKKELLFTKSSFFCMKTLGLFFNGWVLILAHAKFLWYSVCKEDK